MVAMARALVAVCFVFALVGTFLASPVTSKPVASAQRPVDAQVAVPTIPLTGAGLAMTPPMGWNGFNRFYHDVTETTIESEARALVSSGMKAAGYTYVNVDGGWNMRHRQADGSLQPDPKRFPHGMKVVADYVHSLGLKFGIYTSAGRLNCARTSAGSYGHYTQDAADFASWGVDYLKLDWCDVPFHDFPRMTPPQVGRLLAMKMGDALAATGRPMLYDVNDWTGDQPWVWARGTAHMWRTTKDVQDKYSSMVWNFTHNVAHDAQAGPGGWNDPDMLEIGNGGMSTIEYQSQFSLWSEMAAPLIAGNDLATMSATTLSILTNGAVIAVDQDSLGRQGYPVASAGGHWVLTKPLTNGDRAVVLFNQTDKPATISTTAAKIGLEGFSQYELLNVWTGDLSEVSDEVSAVVPPHGVVMYRVTGEVIPRA